MAIRTTDTFILKLPPLLRLKSTKQPLKHCEMAFSPSPFDEIIYSLSFTYIFITMGQIYSVLRALKVCHALKSWQMPDTNAPK